MKPGRFLGICSTDRVNRDWKRVHQCPARNERFAYIASDGYRIEPDDGFWTDLGSVPRICQNIIRRDEVEPAFIGHDWLYDRQEVPRWKADYYLAEMIYTLTYGYCPTRRFLIYWPVRIGGWWAWRLDANEKRAKLALLT
jgi:hypothetical protein